jgi:hypothetical protein
LFMNASCQDDRTPSGMISSSELSEGTPSRISCRHAGAQATACLLSALN